MLNDLAENNSNYERALKWITEDSLQSIISYCFITFKYSSEEWKIVEGVKIETKKPCQNQKIIYTGRDLGFTIHLGICDDEGWPIISVIA